jgi:hypothetical protein
VNDPNKSGVENICRELVHALQGVLSWQWDGRFEAVLAEFGVDNKENVRAILGRCLSMTWDNSNIAAAPDRVRRITVRIGTLRSGQFLFTSDPNHDVFIFCAWWPWGNGETISLRVAPSYKKLSDAETAAKIQQFKGWFGV